MKNEFIDTTSNMSNEHELNSKTIILRARDIGMFFVQKRKYINNKFSGKLSNKSLALIVTAITFVILFLILFIPNYLGVANDGTVTATMNNTGLSYLEKDINNANEYFTRTYQMGYANTDEFSVHIMLINFAKAIDKMLTNDNVFDIRFLAAIYTLLFLPAVYIVVYAALQRIFKATEKTVICALALILFSDVSYISYFNSLYPDALYFIGLLYIIGCAISLQKTTKFSFLHWFLLTFWVVVLCLTKQNCFIIGFVMAAFVALNLRIIKQNSKRVIALCAALIMITAGFSGAIFVEDNFDNVSKTHAMTRGVLFQSTNPADTLKEFSINTSYALLADVSLYDEYPIITNDDTVLEDGFLSQYTTSDIAFYYIKHPSALIAMWDLGVKRAFDIGRASCGNYENTVGMPAGAKSIFWSVASTFKMRSAPRTIGYILLLVIALALMCGKNMFSQKKLVQQHYVYFNALMAALAIGMGHISYIIIRSGDAQLTQNNMILGVCIDLVSFFVITEILNKLNVFEDSNAKA